MRARLGHVIGLAGVLAGCGGAGLSNLPPQPAAAGAVLASVAAGQPGGADLAALVALAKDGPGLREYPEADALVALDQDDYRVEKDGRQVKHGHTIVKLLDAQRGKQKFADVHLPFDTKHQKLTILVARTINPDGSVHVASKDEITDILPPELVGAPIYMGVLERVVSFPAVDRNSVVELEFERASEATLDAPMGSESALLDWDPVLMRKVTLTAPIGLVPRFSVQGMTLAPIESEDRQAGTHTWSFVVQNTPDRHSEDDAPAEQAYTPRVLHSFLPDWQAVQKRITDRFLAAAVPAEVPPAIKAKAAALVAGAGSDLEKARKLFAFVAHDIRSVNLALGMAGYEPHAPEVVLAQRYADQRDKVGLLLALFAAQHLSATPVFVRAWGVPVIAAVPTLAQFDQILVRLRLPGAGPAGEEIWLDPIDEHAQFGAALNGQDTLALALAVDGGAPVLRPYLPPSSSLARLSQSYDIRDNGDLDARFSTSVTGSFAGGASGTLRALKGKNRERYFQQVAARLSPSAVDAGHAVSDLESVAGPIAITQHVTAPRFAPPQGRFRVVELPRGMFSFVDLPSAALSTRKYPLWLGTPRTIVRDASVTLPAGWRVAYAPAKLEGSAPGIHHTAGCTVQGGRKLACHIELTIDRQQISAAEYPAFHDQMIARQEYGRRVVLLERGEQVATGEPAAAKATPQRRAQ